MAVAKSKKDLQSKLLDMVVREERHIVNTHNLTKFIIYDNMVRTRLNNLCELRKNREGIFSYLVSKDEYIHMLAYFGLMNISCDEFSKLISEKKRGKNALAKMKDFGRYRDDGSERYLSDIRLDQFICRLKDIVRTMKVKMSGDGIEKVGGKGGWYLNLKAKNSRYTWNKHLTLLKISHLLQEMEYAVKDMKYNYVAELMFYAGQLYEKAKTINYERDTITGVKVNKTNDETNKARGDYNKKRAPKFQEYVNNLMINDNHSYAQACNLTAIKFSKDKEVSERSIKRYTCNPKSRRSRSIK